MCVPRVLFLQSEGLLGHAGWDTTAPLGLACSSQGTHGAARPERCRWCCGTAVAMPGAMAGAGAPVPTEEWRVWWWVREV